MSFVTGAEMRSIEEAAFRRGVPAEQLMDQAGEGIGRRLAAHFPQPGTAIAYIGKGNNSGDALVALRFLRDRCGWDIALRTSFPADTWTTALRRKRRELGENVREMLPDLPLTRGPLLLLDGLLGIGAKGAPRGPLAPLAEEMAALRRDHGAIIAAIDLPSGLDADTGAENAVTADLTVTIGAPKKGLVTADGAAHAGRILLVPLADLPPPPSDELTLFCPDLFPGLLPPRGHDFHKGDSGRLGILAGSPGFTGAAVLCATAALHMGAGLIVLHVDAATRDSLHTPLPPEIMLKVSADPVAAAFESRHDALAIGPGFGEDEQRAAALLERLPHSETPCLLDADALNAIARQQRQDLFQPHHVLTPHPGEFKRLAPDLSNNSRADAVREFIQRHPCTLLLKGGRTLTGAPGAAIRVNPTGYAGMASGGQGDTLSGVIAALLAGGMKGHDAAALGAWLCGRAAERSLLENGPFTTASQTIAHLGGAVRDWQCAAR